MASAAEPIDPLIGRTIADRYLIEQRVGRGSMGTVYKARHVKVGRPFAVKVLHSELLDAMDLQRFDREAELAGRLHHRNVVAVVDVGETEGLHYMVMEFAEGPDLATVMGRVPMSPARILQLCRQLLEGLSHAHGVGLIHRDFKPENVIVERDTNHLEVPRIVDFGIAILREGGGSTDGLGRLTTAGLVLGTPAFMAPEQAVGDAIDHRIDLFALGVILYEMLAGVLPFDGRGGEVARANLLLEPPTIATRVPSLAVDPLLEAFSRRLMAKKRDDRPPTADAALALLELIANDRTAAAAALGVVLPSPRATTSTHSPASARSPRRRRSILIAIALMALVAIGIVVAVGDREPPTVVVTPETLMTVTPPPVIPPVIPPSVPPELPSEVPLIDVDEPVTAAIKPREKPKDKSVEPVARVDATALARQFQAVGAELRALELAHGPATDLEPRFRLIRIIDAMSTQAKRDAASLVLAKLRADIAARAL